MEGRGLIVAIVVTGLAVTCPEVPSVPSPVNG